MRYLDEGEFHPDAFAGEEIWAEDLDDVDLTDALRSALSEEYADASDEEIDDALANVLDSMSAAEAFNFTSALNRIGKSASQLASDPAFAAVAQTALPINVSPLERMSFLALLCLVRGGQTVAPDPLMGYWDKLEIYRCGDGCLRLALAIAAEVQASKGCRVFRHLGVRRVDLRPPGGGVSVTARSTKDTLFDKWLREKVGGSPLIETQHYDCVVFAVPPTVWSYVEIAPHHPKDVIGLMGSGAAVKFFSNVKERFWIKDGFAPVGGSLEIGQVWEGTDNQTRVKGQDVVLNVFTGSRAPSEKDYKRELGARLYPADPRSGDSGYDANLRHSKLVDWSKQPFIETGYSSPQIGQVFTIGKELNEPFEGRLFFAGEHTQMDHFGYMEGAIRSGERAARLLLDQVCWMFTEPPRLAVAGGSGAAPSG